MRILGKVLLTLGVVALAAGSTVAQQPRGGRGGAGGGVGGILFLLQNKSVQQELKVDPADLEKLPDAVMEALGKVLKPEQIKRLKQISLQTQGARAFRDPKVVQELKLTDDQKEQVDTINKDVEKEMRDLRAAGDFQAMREKMTKMNKETMKKLLGVLKGPQKKRWREMVGEPFEIKMERRPMGRRPRRDA